MKRILKFVSFILCAVLCITLVTSFVSNPHNTSGSTEEVDFSTISMSCLGSSSTLPTKVERAYPKVVKELLGLRRATAYGAGWSTLAYAEDCACHDTEYDHQPFVERYTQMKTADIIVVQGGGANDYGACIPIGDIDDTEITTFYGALNTLMAGLKKLHPNSYIFFMTGYNIYGENAKNKAGIYWSEYQEAIINACKKHNIDCLDIYHNMPMDRETDTVDGAHPTQDFIDNVWSPIIADFIRKNYR